MQISEIDKNLRVEAVSEDGNTVYYDIKKSPFEIYGLYDAQNQIPFKRLPDEIGKNVSERVSYLYIKTAGGRVRFSTNSKSVTVKAILTDISRVPHVALTGAAGLDMYIDESNGRNSRFYGTFIPDINMTDTLVSRLNFTDDKQRYITVNFPSYSGVKEFYIGLDKGAYVGKGAKYDNELPVVFYGNSITQGACSSRPGNIYENIISRRMALDYINLGFSGSGCAENLIVDYMASMKMCAFVSDYDYNAPNVEHLKNTHLKMYQRIREAHPDIPYIMLSNFSGLPQDEEQSMLRRTVVADSYRYALESGDKNVYYIDGESVFRGAYEEMCTVEGIHPTDLGMAMIADKIEAVLIKAFTQNDY